jgi:hypothetical protein
MRAAAWVVLIFIILFLLLFLYYWFLQPRKIGASCSSNTKCVSGSYCIDGICQLPGCTRDSQCGDGKVCASGQCVTPDIPCDSTHPCQTPLVCLNKMCQAKSGCTSDSQCPSTFLCQGGLCVTNGSSPCFDNSECNTTKNVFFPSDGFCTRYYTCSRVSTTGCRNDDDCQEAIPYLSTVCVNGYCALT